MNKIFFISICIIFSLLVTLPAYAAFGRVADYGTYHHVCFKLNNDIYNFVINHTGPDFWPCGDIGITDTYIRIACVSMNDGGFKNNFTNCNRGKSCGMYSFYTDKAVGVHKNSVEPSWDPIGTKTNTITYGNYSYYEYKTINWVWGDVPTDFYTGGTCPSALILGINPTNGSVLKSKVNTLTITTDINATCRYSNNTGLDFNSMASFTNTDSTLHSFNFELINTADYNIYIKCKDSLGDVNQEDHFLRYLSEYNKTSSLISTNPVNNSIYHTNADQVSVTINANTDIQGICRFSNISGTDFINMALFDKTNSTSHSFSTNVSSNNTYNYYLKCKNLLENINTNEYNLNFSVKFDLPTIEFNNSLPLNITTDLTLFLFANFSNSEIGFAPNESCEFCVALDRMCNSEWTTGNVTTEFNAEYLSGNCSYHWNISNYNDGIYNVSFRITDAAYNAGTSSKKITFDRTPPAFSYYYPQDNGAFTVNNTNPANVTNSSLGLTFRYNVDDMSSIANCSLIFDDKINNTNTFIGYYNQFKIKIPAVISSTQYHNWSIGCTDVFGHKSSTATRKFTLVVIGNFSGETTDLGAVNLSRVENLTFEEVNSGKIKFSEIINLSGVSNINDYIKISNNKIEINSSVLSALNKSAILHLYNITSNNPRILRDGIVCPETICKKISYANGTLIFNVTGFSSYSTEEAPTDTISSSSSSSSSGGGGGGSGGGGGGGGGAGYVCNMDWKCSEWSLCADGLQTRECSFVKVPQHVEDGECPSESKSPVTSQKCAVKQETQSTVTKPSETQKVLSNPDNQTKSQNSNSITGGVVSDLTSPKNLENVSIAIGILAVIVLSIFGYRLFYNKKTQIKKK